MSLAVALMLAASLAAGAALVELAGLPVRRPRRWRGRLRRTTQDAAPPSARWAAAVGPDPAVERLLDAAGRLAVPDAQALAVQRRLAALLGAAWGLAVGLLLLAPGLAVGAALLAAGVGRAVPGLLLARAARRRSAALRDEVPELLDLLAAALGCGMPVAAALSALDEWGAGPLARGAGRAASELAHGAGVDRALERLVDDHPVGELEAAVAVLQRARRHGTPVAAPLRALAGGARQARARRALDHAARAAPRVQLVAALLLVPAALCVLASALVAGGLGG